MRRTSFAGMTCSVAQCLEVIGEWWTLLIVRDPFLGVRRFDDFQSGSASRATCWRNAWPRWSTRRYRARAYQENPPR